MPFYTICNAIPALLECFLHHVWLPRSNIWPERMLFPLPISHSKPYPHLITLWVSIGSTLQGSSHITLALLLSGNWWPIIQTFGQGPLCSFVYIYSIRSSLRRPIFHNIEHLVLDRRCLSHNLSLVRL